ncbi:tRNA(fMet)-specific endonuclease VapC [Runella defluvii]|uniref:tRNA(fMet)-specific endonuclease VapC n=1 Tax=Runella defluvii TaxID=370973 RepID=A0A7W6EQH5_9BACT|nr:PIN domain-containing protein [Runella defluvii]MBB3838513.1 tRNA(fMet)-specific endonuclease VapC [Runella defluvii]
MSKFLLDTNICVHFIKGEFNLRNKILQVGFRFCYISEITIAELLYGVENSSPERRLINLQRVQDLRTSFSGRIIPISECLEEYAKQKAQLRKIGRRVEDLDIFIGATAITKGLILATRNTKDFVNMENIQLENYVDS